MQPKPYVIAAIGQFLRAANSECIDASAFPFAIPDAAQFIEVRIAGIDDFEHAGACQVGTDDFGD